jgi:3-phenylpropionate/trans-cinnamate dioxygenase ferredoxin reductase component
MPAGEAQRIVIVGGGQAAAQALQSLRQGGYTGALTLVGDEAALPYQRPPLSKGYMKGEVDEERLYFKPSVWYEDQNIEMLLGTHVPKIDRANQQVLLGHGGHLPYDYLILATGSRPRPLPVRGADLGGVHTCARSPMSSASAPRWSLVAASSSLAPAISASRPLLSPARWVLR